MISLRHFEESDAEVLQTYNLSGKSNDDIISMVDARPAYNRTKDEVNKIKEKSCPTQENDWPTMGVAFDL